MWSYYEWDWQESERRFRRAIELNPNFYLSHQWYGNVLLATLGRMPEAIREMRRAEELNPLSADLVALVSDVLRRAGRFDEALAEARKAVDLDPNSKWTRGFLALAYLDKKMYADGVREMERCCEARSLAVAYAVAGRNADARSLLDRLLKQRTPGAPADIARIYAALGDNDLAFEWLEKGYADHDLDPGFLATNTEFAGVRADPRYAVLRRKLGLPR